MAEENKKEVPKAVVSQDSEHFVKNEDKFIDSAANNIKTVEWSGPEFIEYDKNSVWYFYLMITCLILSAVIYLLLKDIVTIVVIVVAFFALGLYGSRKPKEIEYSVSSKGVKIGQKSYSFSNFKYIILDDEGDYKSVSLIPLKRFAVSVSLFYPAQKEGEIMPILSENLPVEPHRPDLVDRLMKSIRF